MVEGENFVLILTLSVFNQLYSNSLIELLRLLFDEMSQIDNFPHFEKLDSKSNYKKFN